MEWIKIIAAFLSGGLAGTVLQIFIKRGKVIYDNSHIKFNYFINGRTQIHHILSFELDIQFINTSGNQIILKDFKGRYYNSDDFYDLVVSELNILPAFIMEPKIVKTFSLTFRNKIDKSDFSMLYIADGTAYFELSYINNGKLQKVFIHGDQFTMSQNWVAE